MNHMPFFLNRKYRSALNVERESITKANQVRKYTYQLNVWFLFIVFIGEKMLNK